MKLNRNLNLKSSANLIINPQILIKSIKMPNRNNNHHDDDDKGLLWKLPVAYSNKLGKLGPAFGLGAGCGIGFGVGLVGGAGLGPGIPGLQLGFGFGAGCGVGLGFGYGAGRGIAYDENRKHSNVGKLFSGPGSLPTQDEIGFLIEEVVVNTKKLIKATHREVEKWRRY